jgi:2-keto-3-deoxy-6-phosphogluconate aldolase
LREGEARRQGIAVRVAKLPIIAVLRSRTTSETRGFMKALVEADGDRILGFVMIGADAGEVIPVVQTAMLAGMPYRVCATRLSHTRQWQKASTSSSRMCPPDNARVGDIGTPRWGALSLGSMR